MASRITTDWTGIPHTHKNASVVETRTAIRPVLAVEIKEGKFRGSRISGVFELADANSHVKVDKNGKVTIQVQLGWFGVKPPTCWANVTIVGHHMIHRSYKGPVVHNIQSPTWRN